MLDDDKLRELVISVLRSLKKDSLSENLKMLFDNFYSDGLQLGVL